MGVLSCSRKGCSNIMCRTYVSNIGYICLDCQNEFKRYLNNENLKFTDYNELLGRLEIFMNTNVNNGWESVPENYFIDIDDFFKDNTTDF